MLDQILPLVMIAGLIPVAAVTGFKALMLTLHPTDEQMAEEV